MLALLILPFLLQTLIISIDEFYFHIRRGLPKWERLGHPLDTLTVLACFAFVLLVSYSGLSLKLYIALAIFSCLFVTKDEFVHKECCPAAEQWLHALLFLNHPIVLTVTALLWPILSGVVLFTWMEPLLPYRKSLWTFFCVQAVLTSLFFLYQLIYWNLLCKEKSKA